MTYKLIPTILAFIAGVMIGALLFSSTEHDHQNHPKVKDTKKEQTAWTCSMHPQIQEDKPGQCPLCGMDLIPIKKENEAKKKEIWTCSMHPQIKQDGPGQCPLCGMDLIPMIDEGANDSDREVKLSKYAMKLAEIQSEEVVRKEVYKKIRVVGKLAFDETLQKTITAWVPGRLDRLFVDYRGVSVKKGDHLVSLYSPELLAAQEELLQTHQAVQTSEASTKQTLQNTFNSIREKLRLWGLKDKQIKEVLKSGQPTDHMTIYSPLSGVVIHKMIKEGMYVKAGSPLYMIADLSNLWLKLDIYESDLPWIRFGQDVKFETEAWPGEIFKGKIIFIDPVVNPSTRTIKVRVHVPNPEGKLKPEMFVRSSIHAPFQASGKVLPPQLKGKWISPMHPEIVKDEFGQCDICGMDLVKAESLFPESGTDVMMPLVIPASAALITGKRAVVYIDMGEGRFQGRDVQLGPRAGDRFIVSAGLEEGERVVTRGNFKLDSAVQIKAGSSMMNPKPANDRPTGSHHHGSHKHEMEKPQKRKGSRHHGSHKYEDEKTEKRKGSHHHGSHKHE